MNREREIKELFDRITGMTPEIKMERLPDGMIRINKYFFLKHLFVFLILISIIAFFVLLLNSSDFRLISIPPVLFILFIFLLKKTDNYYIIDTINKKIIYHYSFFGITVESERYRFSDLLCLTVNGKRGSVQGIKYWEYYLTLITKRGGLIPLSEPKKNIDIKLYDEPAMEIAGIFNIPFKKPEPAKSLKNLTGLLNSISELEYLTENEIDHRRKIRTISAIMLIIAAVIAGFIYRDPVFLFLNNLVKLMQ